MYAPLPFSISRLLCLVVLLLSAVSAQGQRLSTYVFTQSSTPYVVFAPDSGVGSGSCDDQSFVVPTKFAFRYNGGVFTSVQVCTNGFVKIGPGSVGTGSGQSWENTTTSSGRAITGTTNTQSAVGFNADLISIPNTNQVGIKWGGAAPNRFVAFQWKSFRRYFSGAINDSINFQIRLNESGAIEYHYGTITTDGGDNFAQVGIRGTDQSPLEIQALDGDWSSLRPSTTPATYIPFGSRNTPARGTLLRFAPTPPTAKDLALQGVNLSAGRYRGCLLSSQEPLSISVVNLGSATQTSARVGYTVNGGPFVFRDVTFPGAGLAPGASFTVPFTGAQGLNLSTFGVRRVKASVILTGDTILRNDTLATTTTVGAPRLASTFPTIGGINQASTEGWRQASGNPITSDTSSTWRLAFPYTTESIGAYVDSTATPINEWFLLTGVKSGGALSLRFKASVTLNWSGSIPVTSIGDDSIKVMITNSCISGWRQVGFFTQADLVSGRLTNQLQTFTIGLASADEVLSVGFYIKNRGTRNASQYRFHIDDIQFAGVVDAQAVNILGFNPIATNVVSYCPTESWPIRLVVRNNGLTRLDSLTIGYSYNSSRTEQFKYPLSNGSTPGIAAGATDTLSVLTPQTGAPRRGNTNLRVFTMLNNETLSSRLNDTLSLNFIIGIPQPMPVTGYNYFTRMSTRGWTTSRTRSWIGSNQSGWSNGSNFINRGDTTAATTIFPTATAKTDWLVSPSFTHSGTAYLNFNTAISSNGTTDVISDIDDDSLKVFYRENCGTWQSLKTFTQADVTAGTLDTNLRNTQMQVPVTGASGEVQFAFYAINNSTPAPLAYKFHINKVFVAATPTAAKSLIANKLAIYPNPTEDVLNIEMGGKAELRSATLSNLQGQVVYTARLAGHKGQLTVGHLPNGIYVLRCVDVAGQVYVQKIAVQ